MSRAASVLLVLPAGRSAWTMARLGATLAAWLALGAGAGLALAIVAPTLLGYRTLTVLSGSMEPTLRTGDLVVTSRISAREARIGDVVTFPDPEDRSRLITHRVRRVLATGSLLAFETKGDRNNTPERWSIEAAGTIGRVEYRLPRLGYGTGLAASSFGRLALIVLPVLLLGGLELKRIWTKQEEEPGDESS